MILINKPSNVPPKLIEYQESLKKNIAKYGSVNNIPKEIGKKVLSGYRHADVKKVLFKCSHQKCAFCETKPFGSYLEVEHFAPKSLYPDLTLEWDNLLPSCQACNDNKSIHDTLSEPIINPSKTHPEPYFEYEWVGINPSKTAPDYELAKRTIEVCNLNRMNLRRARSEILIRLSEFEDQLNNRIEKINESDTDRKKMIRLKKLKASIDDIKSHLNETEQYSGLCRYFLKKSEIFNKAKEIGFSN